MTTISALILAQVSLPPPEFDRPAPNMVVRHMSLSAVNRRCHVHMPEVDEQVAACGLSGHDRDGKWYCLVNLPYKGSVSPEAYERLYLHERGLCNMMAEQ